MTSEERRIGRRLRRAAKRFEKKLMRRAEYDCFDKVFTFQNMWQAYKNSRKGVRWKTAVILYSAMACFYIRKTLAALKIGKYKSPGFHTFDVKERGKLRHIQAVFFQEKVVLRCLRDACLSKAFEPSFLLDNWASQKGKGYHFALKRVRKALSRYIRKHGLMGHVLLFDFKEFFASISHKLLHWLCKERVSDPKLLTSIFYFIHCFGKVGLGLGSIISQTFALAVGNLIDHAITELFPIDFHGRYMDDGIVICESKETLKAVLTLLKKLSEKYGLRLNEKKTRIVSLHHGFTFLKKRFSFAKTGRIIMKISRKSISHERQLLKKLVGKMREGTISKADVYQSFQGWKNYASFGNAYRTVHTLWSELDAMAA